MYMDERVLIFFSNHLLLHLYCKKMERNLLCTNKYLKIVEISLFEFRIFFFRFFLFFPPLPITYKITASFAKRRRKIIINE